ncbi:MAG: M1 family aminopeptidase [Bacteroidales bacterium]
MLFFYSISGTQSLNHNIYVRIDPGRHFIEATDTITIPASLTGEREEILFKLNRNLKPGKCKINGRTVKPTAGEPGNQVTGYIVGIPSDSDEALTVVINYTGTVYEEIGSGAAEYARGFSETSGIIDTLGIYLASSSFWIPRFGDGLITFQLHADLPSEWLVVSQGKRMVNRVDGDRRITVYNAENPGEEAYLIGAKWTEYSQMSGDVEVQAFLRTPDPELAARYLNATSGYLETYENLIGPYPYAKFALVENFWETGFGMPSFTLLGSKIIRFPFILYTSYPHELLHNWWGNSVYVDYQTGNWCEGLTAYMADHLMKEKQGKGALYRQETLKKYADYVSYQNDFPLNEFRSRHNPAEEAVGYGKCLMFNHMLRNRLGDSLFIEGYRRFYREYIFHRASFEDIKTTFETVTNTDLDAFFRQWILRPGAPKLSLSDVEVTGSSGSYSLTFSLGQWQPEPPFEMIVPVAVWTEDTVTMAWLTSKNRADTFHLSFDSRPLRIEVDPQFDLFRRLDRSEVPPSLSQLFGAVESVVILPAKSPFLNQYREVAQQWKEAQEVQGKKLTILMDSEVTQFPKVPAWVFGFENKFARAVSVSKYYPSYLSPEEDSLFSRLTRDGSVVYSLPDKPGSTGYTGFLGTTRSEALQGLARLLIHYGKYSYLGFKGDKPENVLKGNFPAFQSVLHYNITAEGEQIKSRYPLPVRKALGN